ncbi:hypothetical protein SAMD00019534_073220 [Acytostelium subglobosum LB1]|uniref:hypothetical protein n=1 Tax=Acytostelium subglobosum LB1 TaxID=1410327 RepID=UPI000644A5CF|nr:hypothetical protein SAMD00019534_073220 [Acytostelium subglobosum LB1]GAM24147.1 hypothetical protein SAMD00019534_073220 [Acytostelium subglobosum LB1]|eukprot:XP_012753183.1 hypothetical protein SAMD00019534_073220 [Acytostelium subglobosum LB1]
MDWKSSPLLTASTEDVTQNDNFNLEDEEVTMSPMDHLAAAGSFAANIRKQKLNASGGGKSPPTPPPQSAKPTYIHQQQTDIPFNLTLSPPPRKASNNGGGVLSRSGYMSTPPPVSPPPVPARSPLNSSTSSLTSTSPSLLSSTTPLSSSVTTTPRTMNNTPRSSTTSTESSPRTSANYSNSPRTTIDGQPTVEPKKRPLVPARKDSGQSAGSPCTSPINEKITRSLSSPIPRAGFIGLSKPKSMTASSTMNAKRFLKHVLKDADDSSDEDDEEIIISAPPSIQPDIFTAPESTNTTSHPHEEGMSQRNYQVQEILASEKKYINNLNRIMTIYLLPLRDKATTKDKIISIDEINQIFSNIDFIFNLHKTFLVDFQSRIADNWSDTQRIGDIFRGIAPCLNAYTIYANSFNQSIVLLNSLQKSNSVFKSFLAKCLAKPSSKGLNLSGYLIMPIQRIPRYRLMLERLLTETSSDHVDYNDLTESLKDINAVAVKLEERMEQFQIKNKVLDIQNNLIGFEGEFIKPSRVFCMEGDLKKISNRVVNTRHFFLFNDLLIYCQREGKNQYRYKQTLPLEKCWVKDIPSTARFGHLFQIIEPTKTYFLNAPSESEKQTWMRKLNDVINKYVIQINYQEQRQSLYEKRGSTTPREVLQELEALPKDQEGPNPTWLKDQLVKDCMTCSASFTMRRRRHHCRKCGKIYCTECCPITDLSQYLPGRKVRLCKGCFEEISVHIEVMMQNQSISDGEQQHCSSDQSTYDHSSSSPSTSVRHSRSSQYSQYSAVDLEDQQQIVEETEEDHQYIYE